MNKAVLARTTLLASALALALSACGGGGGGGNTRSDSPPTSPPVSPPPPPPPTSPPPPTTPPPPPQPAVNAHLSLINAQGLGTSGYDGSGVRIGVVDSGVNRNHPALQGRVVANYTYLDPRTNNTAVDDVVGHGTTVAQLAAGKAFGAWPGGVAPGAQIVSARIIADEAPEDDGSGQGNEVDGALGLASIHDDLIAAGVKVMNNSWGGLYWTNPDATAAIAAEYRPFIISNGGLVVFAAGNDSRASPSDMAALPSQPGPNGTLPAADLERGWLTVAALDTSTPNRLESYSNACGIAMRYCLVAPGTVMFTGTDDTAGSPTYWYGSGTSYAAPLVSGAAAVVWQKFGYFSNDLVRQTLLGTATDLGTPGVDATFGYGLLNVAKALKGPGKFDWGDVSVVLPAGRQDSWSNGISGAGGLTVDGGGAVLRNDGSDARLWLSGNNSFVGGLHLRGNAQVVLSDQFASDVQVDAGSNLFVQAAALQGRVNNSGSLFIDTVAGATSATRLQGEVVNHGVFYAGPYPQTTLAGSFTQGGDGEYWSQLGNDPLHILGAAALDGRLYFYSAKQGYVARAHTEVLLADGGVSGQFASLGYNSGAFSLLEATIGYGATSVWVDVSRMNMVAAAQSLGTITPAALVAATRVEATFTQIDASTSSDATPPPVAVSAQVLQGAAKIQQSASAEAFETTLRSLSGSLHGLSAAATFDGIDQNRRALAMHLDQTLARGRIGGAWMREVGGLGQSGGAGGYDLHGWMVGNDVRMGQGMVGYAFGENRANSQVAAFGDRGRDRQTQAQLYGGWSRGAFYAMGQLGAGHYQRDLDRHLLLGDAWFGTHSRYEGAFSSAGLESGYNVRLGGQTRLVPYAGLQYARVETPAFAESGGLGYGLRSNGGNTSRTLAVTGLRTAFEGRRWTWNAYAEWQQPLASHGQTLQASFTGVDAWAPLQMLESGSSTLLGVSAGARLAPTTSLALAYDQRLGSNPAHAWSLRYAFGF